ncbi:MAG: hypothetical protein FWF59_15695 [Turicibacter sp.]|nr:hypothetical protein [Turicibacter sp.]
MEKLICMGCKTAVTGSVDTAHYHLYNYCEQCYMEATGAEDDESWAKGC